MKLTLIAFTALAVSSASLPRAAIAAENKNCPGGTAVFRDKYIGGSELRFGPRDPTLIAAPHNQGTMTLTVGGKIENYYLMGSWYNMYVVNTENDEISDEISFTSRYFIFADVEDAWIVSMHGLQAVRKKFLPGSEPIGSDWSFKRCEPQIGPPPSPPARFIPLVHPRLRPAGMTLARINSKPTGFAALEQTSVAFGPIR